MNSKKTIQPEDTTTTDTLPPSYDVATGGAFQQQQSTPNETQPTIYPTNTLPGQYIPPAQCVAPLATFNPVSGQCIVVPQHATLDPVCYIVVLSHIHSLRIVG
jgi:hypothetical protein